MLAFLDQALFAGAVALGRLQDMHAVTLSVGSQFVGRGSVDEPLDALIEVVAETGKLLFLRGLMEQSGRPVLSFDGTLRKVRRAAPPAA
jgi:hypothetical protein